MNTNLLGYGYDTLPIGLEYAGIDTTGRRVMGLGCQK